MVKKINGRVVFKEQAKKTQEFIELWLKVVDSTMLVARNCTPLGKQILIVAEKQTKGRGTQNRHWKSQKGNLHVTFALHNDCIHPSRKTLLPLEIGSFLINGIQSFLPEALRGQVEIKWPNDILMNGKKVAGILIEATRDHVLIGLGVNITHSPQVEDGGRPSIHLNSILQVNHLKERLIYKLWNVLRDELLKKKEAKSILTEWSQWVDWEKSVYLRKKGKTPFQPIMINEQGQLLVENAEGNREWLSSDYLF